MRCNMEILVFTGFEKRKNSTKRPDDSTGITKNVTLKDKCSLTKPSFFFSDTVPYGYIKAWGNYYFVDSINYDINGAQYMNCSIDVLATWKDEIANTTAYILFSSSDYDVNIRDSRIPQKVTRTWDYKKSQPMLTTGYENGTVILTTANDSFGVCNYALTMDKFKGITRRFIADTAFDFSKITEIFSDAMGSIISVKYIPIDISKFGNDTAQVYLGDWDAEEDGILTNGMYADDIDLDIPWTYNDFRRSSDYTRFTLALPYVGCLELRPENLVGATKIKVHYVVSAATGTILYSVYCNSTSYINAQLLLTVSGSFGRTIPMAHDQVDIIGAINGAIGFAGSTAAIAAQGIESPLSYGGYGIAPYAFGGAVASAAKSVMSINTHDFVTIGGYGGAPAEFLLYEVWLISTTVDCKIEPSELTELYGRPCNKVRKIDGLTGYVETLGFDISIESTSEIKELINSNMNSGVYLE